MLEILAFIAYKDFGKSDRNRGRMEQLELPHEVGAES
jgi:hypothetical protein